MAMIKLSLLCHYTVQSLYNAIVGVHKMDRVISEPSYKGRILQRNYRKMTIKWSFSYNSFVKFHGTKFGSRNMTVLYPIWCYKEACYKGTVLYLKPKLPKNEDPDQTGPYGAVRAGSTLYAI